MKCPPPHSWAIYACVAALCAGCSSTSPHSAVMGTNETIRFESLNPALVAPSDTNDVIISVTTNWPCFTVVDEESNVLSTNTECLLPLKVTWTISSTLPCTAAILGSPTFTGYPTNWPQIGRLGTNTAQTFTLNSPPYLNYFFFLRVTNVAVTLAWNPSTDINVIGYVLYWGTNSGVYSSNVPLGLVTNYTVTTLQPGRTYYFAATTIAAGGLQSTFSAEVAYLVPRPRTTIQ